MAFDAPNEPFVPISRIGTQPGNAFGVVPTRFVRNANHLLYEIRLQCGLEREPFRHVSMPNPDAVSAKEPLGLDLYQRVEVERVFVDPEDGESEPTKLVWADVDDLEQREQKDEAR